jgi:diaminobutyrate-2-oxoglutarate transaminase
VLNRLPSARTAPTIDEVFARRESEIRSYCRSFPAEFARARNAELWDVDGHRYLDFLAGAGSLNFGHNHPRIKQAMIDYLLDDGVPQGLDLHTEAKARFLETLERVVLEPRGLDVKVQFTGPTGTNAVEAALKLARKVTGRTNIVAFRGGYHGHSLGALAVTANVEQRRAAGVPLGNATFMPFPSEDNEVDSIELLVGRSRRRTTRSTRSSCSPTCWATATPVWTGRPR